MSSLQLKKKAYSWKRCMLTLCITSEIFGVCFHLLVNCAANKMCRTIVLNCFGKSCMERPNKAKCPTGLVIILVTWEINENTEFQKLVRHLHVHIMCIRLPLWPTIGRFCVRHFKQAIGSNIPFLIYNFQVIFPMSDITWHLIDMINGCLPGMFWEFLIEVKFPLFNRWGFNKIGTATSTPPLMISDIVYTDHFGEINLTECWEYDRWKWCIWNSL